MNAIKDQVSSLVNFTAKTFEALTEERNKIQDRLIEGIEKMKDIKVFSEAEVKEISQYALNVLDTRYNSAKEDITKELRTSFEF